MIGDEWLKAISVLISFYDELEYANVSFIISHVLNANLR